ncbi:ACT domain-containing protein [Thermoactinomyces mirandus]|uniref:ACT domain-containing protein n=1 Tax=Thermoactinomyces mirandus TaxID=2756294 RepID=A0A7W1XS87_9BACL|nr:ACT domain-containing protein [Thermoactinomyces mirandus]MBA4602289.1 ACT domain-containing protein [Thermoactinomyces mirandus]
MMETTKINGFEVKLSGKHPAIIIRNNDRFGAVASVAEILAKHKINIAQMEVTRNDIGKEALMVIEVDDQVDDHVLKELEKANHIIQISRIEQ